MNFKKITYIFLGILIAVGILVGGNKLREKREHDQMVEIVESKEVKNLIEEDLKYFDKNALTKNGKIKEYKIDKESIKKNPMGGIMVNIYINNNRKYKISYTLVNEIPEKGIDIGGRGISKDLNVLLREN